MRIAIVHDWLTGMRGGEKCLEVACELFPEADLFTLFYVPGSTSQTIENRRIHTSVLNRLPRVARYYRHTLPLMPLAMRLFDFRGYDALLSSSHCVAKAARPARGRPHVCYCHTPMRYVWAMYDSYFGHFRGAKRWLMRSLAACLRRWDRSTAPRVTHFVANSENVRRRIASCYGRSAEVIYPPVDTEFYVPDGGKGDFYLCVSAFAPYKRLDLAVAAFRRLGRKLVIIGTGQCEERLKAVAPPNVQFLGWRSQEEVRDHYRRAKAFLFPGEEDFGITPVEAQACGTPVIAYGAGGALETVVGLNGADRQEGPTGVFFTPQTPAALAAAVELFEKQQGEFSPAVCRRNAERFSAARFRDQFRACLAQNLGL
jgi:glycosyltransferase involved in cell wall biosynthesis